MTPLTIINLMAATILAACIAPEAGALDFPDGTATPPEVCGACHKAIYKEFVYGFGSDNSYHPTTLPGKPDQPLKMSPGMAGSATGHALAGSGPFPLHARQAEQGGASCNVCHFPEPFTIPDINSLEIAPPTGRPAGKEQGGLTCASCHLTPDGKIRGRYGVKAPHATVQEQAIQTSTMCAYCHSMGKKVSGQQTQTFYEWRDDFFRTGMGRQQCQDCHMPGTMRKLAEESNSPERVSARHLWTGGRSLQRIQSALSLVAVQPAGGANLLAFHLINIGAGHSVPTGSNRRAIYLDVEIINGKGKRVAGNDWMFAPWYGARPDDRKYLEEDKQRPDAVAAAQADAQGPHEPPLRAGEERVLSWNPALKPGRYTLKARLTYDLNRYNPRSFKQDQNEFKNISMAIRVK